MSGPPDLPHAAPPSRWHRAALRMDTVVTMTVITARPEPAVAAALASAFQAFAHVEAVCSRFQPDSEVSRLSRQVGTPVQVSPLLFAAVRFAREVAVLTAGVFDPAVGARLEALGFTREYLSGRHHPSGVAPDRTVSYLDIQLDEQAGTVLLHRPLVIDLGAVAKGLAVDLALRDLADFEGVLIDAGGDIAARGRDSDGEPWRIGLRDPIHPERLIRTLQLADGAVCTSGGYFRPSPARPEVHHIIDVRTGLSPAAALSCTVVAPYALAADAMATAALLLGCDRGLQLLERVGLAGLLVGPGGAVHLNAAMQRYVQ